MLVRQTTDLKENLKRKYIFILGHQKERQDEMTHLKYLAQAWFFVLIEH